MNSRESNTQRRLTELLEKLAVREGVQQSPHLQGVTIGRCNQRRSKGPVLYEPSIVFVAQGGKRAYLGHRSYCFDPHHYFVLTLPMPFECETEASVDEPLFAFSVQIDVAVLNELLMKIDPRTLQKPDSDAVHGMYVAPMNDALGDAAVRLLQCMLDPVEAKILGPSIIREITFHVLVGTNGGALCEIMALNGRIARLQRAIERMHTECDKPLDIKTLADEAGMSSSAFHHNFKALTANSPLQYMKTIRLHKARLLMLNEGISAGAAAARVGYESASQFSREFKRFFGESPIAEVAKTREIFGLNHPVLSVD